jgi:hypothetical protein
MITLRRFLVWQSLLIWQGGFFFYSAVVVPVGTDAIGSFGQGAITRHVTVWMNLIGIATLVCLLWDLLAESTLRKTRVNLWLVMAVGLVVLFVLHPKMERLVDFEAGYAHDHPAFYRLHKIYLYTATVQWLAGMAYAAASQKAWRDSARFPREPAAK